MLFLKFPRDGSRDAHLEHCIICWPKGSSSFYVKTQRNRRFSFSPITVLNNVFTVLFHCFLQYCRHLHNSISPKSISVWPSQYKASFNKHRSIEIIYNVSLVFSLHFSQYSLSKNGTLESPYIW